MELLYIDCYIEASMPQRAARSVKLVFFIGGVTFAELSALRWWAKQEEGLDLIIATTKIINGDTLLDSLVDRIEGATHPALAPVPLTPPPPAAAPPSQPPTRTASRDQMPRTSSQSKR